MNASRFSAIETLLLTAALIAGTVLGVTAFSGGLEPSKVSFSAGPPTGSPAPTDSSPSPSPSPSESEPPLGTEEVFFSTAQSNLIQGSNPCKIELRFLWKPSPESSVPIGAKAVIKATGPGLAASYTRNVTSGGIDLRVPVTVKGSSKWVASVQSVDGRPANPTPLELTVSDAFC